MLWSSEVANAILVAERRKRVSSATVLQIMDILRRLPIRLSMFRPSMKELVAVAQNYSLSAYDAEYLWLAVSTGRPIATLDERLTEAAHRANVALY
jgi:predicted nucleic acid-binding protein